MRATLLAVALSLLGAAPPVPRPDVLVEDFEGDTYGEWKAEGEAFGKGPARGTLPNQMPVSTALSVEHGATFGDAVVVVLFVSGLFEEPVTDASVDLRQRQAPAVGPRGKNPRGAAPAGSPLASASIPD
jgi:hypothetical protein